MSMPAISRYDAPRARNTETRRVGSVVLAFAILRHLGGSGAASGVSAIARAVGASPSSCFNILKTLVSIGIVTFDDRSKTYLLGDGLVDLARPVLRRNDVIDVAQPHMDRLAHRFDATVGLWRVGEKRLTLVAKCDSGASTRIYMEIGHRQPIGAGAAGRCVLAARRLSKHAVLAIFKTIRWHRPLVAETYWEQVCLARELGWAVDENDLFQGITSVAAPVLDHRNEPRYLVAISAFSGRHGTEEIEEMGTALLAVTREMARTISNGAGS